jgi:hypothetical protein
VLYASQNKQQLLPYAGRGITKIYCFEGSQAVPASPFGKGNDEMLGSEEGSVMGSGFLAAAAEKNSLSIWVEFYI